MIVRELLTRLGFTVDPAGAKQYEKSMDGIRKHAATLQENLGGILGVLGVGMSFAFFKDVTSEFSDLEARLANNLGANGAADAMARLHQTALLTYQPTESLIEGFISMKSALDTLGMSTEKQMDLQQSMADGFTATGIKGQRAETVMMWLNRAFTKNKVSAEEFNGILENGGDDLLAILAKDMGTTVGQLKDMATNGKITGKVLADFFLKKMPEFRKQSEQMPVTLNDAFGRVQEAFRWWVYETDKASSASKSLVPIIMWFADHVEVLAFGVAGLLVPALMSLVLWIGSTLKAFGGLSLAVASNPFTWILLAIAALILGLQDLYTWVQGGKSVLGNFFGDFKNLSEEAKKPIIQLAWAWRDLTDLVSHFGQAISALFRGDLIEALKLWWAAMNDGGQFILDFLAAPLEWVGLFNMFDEIKTAFSDLVSFFGTTWTDFWDGAANSARSTVNALRSNLPTWMGGLPDESAPPPANMPAPPLLPPRASGGPVSKGRAYMVGEEGPEPFVPTSNGWVLPNGLLTNIGSSMGERGPSSQSTTVNMGGITVNAELSVPAGTSEEQLRAISDGIGPKIRAHIMDMIDSTMPSFPETT